MVPITGYTPFNGRKMRVNVGLCVRKESTTHGLSNRKHKYEIDVQLILGTGGNAKLFFCADLPQKN